MNYNRHCFLIDVYLIYEFKLKLSIRSLLYLSIIIRNVEIITPILIQETPLDMIALTVSKLYGGGNKSKRITFPTIDYVNV